MKFVGCSWLCLIAFGVLAEGSNGLGEDSGPEVYVDISKRAQQNAVKHDGLKFLGGLTYAMSDFKATIRDGSHHTKQSMNNLNLTLGIDYSKKFKKNFIIGGTLLVDFWKAQKKSGDMQSFNQDYYNRISNSQGHTYSGELKKPCMTPEISIRGGYIFQNMGTIAFLKLGVQRMQAEYIYSVDGKQISSANAIKYIPIFGIGGHKRFNKKFGVSLELNFPYKKECEKMINYEGTVYHKVKMGSTTIRALATYSVPSKTN